MFLIISIEEYLLSSMRCVFILCTLLLLDKEFTNSSIKQYKNVKKINSKDGNIESFTSKIKSKIKFIKGTDILSFFSLILVLIPALITKIFIRDFWLVCEDRFEARDNGYWFFKYVKENHPKQKIAYAIDKKANDYNKVKHLGKIISYGTIEHWFWYIVADKNISSQKGGKPNAAVCYFFEVVLKLRKKNRVFLQHGITINDAKFLYYTNTYINKFITATIPETEFIKEKFGYPEENICLAGFCRFDNLNDFEVDNNQILVMPTWRQWIAKGVEMKKIEGSDNFIESNYFKNWSEFLNNDSLKNLLKKHNKKLVFYPHRNMQKYLSYFTTDCENIVIANSKENDVQELLKKSAVLITDYSSVFFDFAYMKKPLIFYQFDEEIFRNYQYEKGYFDYKNNGFSMWTKDSQSLIKYLESVIDNNMQFTKETTIDRYFPFKDNKNCERNYLAIKNGANKFTKEKEHDS